MSQAFQTSCGVIMVTMPRDIFGELASLAKEIKEVVRGNGDSGLEVLRRTFLVKIEMIDKRKLELEFSEERLLDDLILAMREAVEGLAVTDRQTRMVEGQYLALLVSLVGKLLGGKTMSQQQQQQEVQDLVNELVAARKAFTAFNVTKELRNKGKQVFHRDLRNAVHGLYRQQQMADYCQTQVQPSGFPSPAILYYPPEVDPNEFTGSIITAKVQPTSPDPDDDEEEEEDDDDDTDGVTRSINNDGVLFVPRWMGRNLNARQRGAYVMVSTQVDEIEIHMGKPNDPSDHVHVDPRNNIRLSRSMLIKLGADWPSYKISKEADVVVIRKG